jgi:pimeloyl-ACP methyl ester carboxylesterase
VEGLLSGEPAALIGSSMGGYLAALAASRHPGILKVVLMAPAFNFVGRWVVRADADGQWSKTGWLRVFHYGDKEERELHYGLILDAGHYPRVPDFRQPALIFHGVHDDTVPIEESRRFAEQHLNAKLREFDSDHELSNVLEPMTAEALAFLL